MKKIFTLLFCSVLAILSYSQPVVISQIYGGGGNTNAQFRNDFVELFNNSAVSVSVAGFSVQYASAAGTFNAANTVALTGLVPAFGYYLVQFGSGGTVGNTLPTADATSITNLSATAGKVALVNSTIPLTGMCPYGTTVVDFVGYGTTADCFFGTGPAPAGSNTTSVTRNGAGTVNTDNNAANFTAAPPSPRNSAVILPVKLISFTASAKNNTTIFNWKTATEQNTSRFDIEQSLNGKDFTPLATVAAAGNSTVEKSYSYTGNLNTTTTFYRLKIWDADGKFTTSSVVKIATSKNGFAIGNVYPVPAINKVTVEWNSNRAGATAITITDVSGRAIRTISLQAAAGFNQAVLDVQSLSNGQYFIRLKDETNQVQTIITKQ